MLLSPSNCLQEKIQGIRDHGAPKHVAIIMDGNRRWAAKKFQEGSQGHRAGAQCVMDICRAGKKIGVQHLTLYTFSTENWRRSEGEVSDLMDLLSTYLVDNCEAMKEEGVRLQTIGDLTPFTPELQQIISETKEYTKDGQHLDLILALNYGARDEITRAVRGLAQEVKEGRLDPKNISEDMIATRLDTAPWGDPALLIRTAGEFRLSNYLLWQISYGEIHITPTLWPDFGPEDLFDAVEVFQGRKRRFGV